MRSSVRAVRAEGRQPLWVGATPVPHAEILDAVRDIVAGEGIDLRIEIFDSFDEPNELLAAGKLHANFFQYLPFLADFNRRTSAGLVPVIPVHIEPFGLYSTWIPDLGAIPDYAEVGLPSDAVNVDRALTMLDALGLIALAPQRQALATVADVRSNPRELLFKEFASWQLAGVRKDVDVVFLFGNQAMEWGVDTAGALYCDRADPAYAEYLVARPDTRHSPAVTVLAEALTSETSRDFITTTYAGQLLAAF
jgi:D-methionine transport system substrate-binding protein